MRQCHGRYRLQVAREPRDIEIAGVHVSAEQQVGWVRTGDTTAVPTRFEAKVFLADPAVVVLLLVLVDSGGRPHVREFHVAARVPNPPITSTLMRRIPVDHLLKAAVDAASVTVKNRPDIHAGAFQLPSDPDHQAWVSPQPAPTGRGREVPVSRVVRAAEVYLQALAAGSAAPTETVASVLGYSRSSASRDIRNARKQGLLPPTGEAAAPSSPPTVLPPSSSDVDPNPVWRRFDDPNVWQPIDDALRPVKHPGVNSDDADQE